MRGTLTHAHIFILVTAGHSAPLSKDVVCVASETDGIEERYNKQKSDFRPGHKMHFTKVYRSFNSMQSAPSTIF